MKKLRIEIHLVYDDDGENVVCQRILGRIELEPHELSEHGRVGNHKSPFLPPIPDGKIRTVLAVQLLSDGKTLEYDVEDADVPPVALVVKG